MQVELRNIHKSFGRVHANRGISLMIPAGTIQGLLGENGAGKSTLMKILSGFIGPDAGEIALDGRVVEMASPADSIGLGIGMLHQDPLDFPAMRVIDNFILGERGGLLPQRAHAKRSLLELASRFDISLDPEAEVASLTVGERQQLEILRLLWLGARVLILDEPTTGISAQQKAKLFETLRRLAEDGKAVVFVSHKLEEVEELCHQVAVLRDGELVGEVHPPYRTERLVELMFGRPVQLDARERIDKGDPVLELEDLSVESARIVLRKVSLRVRAGEVIGLAGMEGSGQRLLLNACAGLTPAVGGEMRVGGRRMAGKTYRDFLKQGVAYLPAARLEEGLIPGLTLTEHFVLRDDSRNVFIDWGLGHSIAQGRIDEFKIRGVPTSTVEALSGGNQQRALLALMRTPPEVLLMEHPTRGLDMESAIWVWRKLKERCAHGAAIVFISSDLEEILHYSDRILVFFGGEVSGPLDASATSLEQLGERIGGKGFEPRGAHD